MRKPLVRLLLVVSLGIALCGGLFTLLMRDSQDLANYKRVQAGMSVDEVRAILGPGTVIPQAQVPTFVVAVNPADVDASLERARRAGVAHPTVRDYPTRLKPIVEGDLILEWVNPRTGERILVAFKDGKVCEKNYWHPNYL